MGGILYGLKVKSLESESSMSTSQKSPVRASLPYKPLAMQNASISTYRLSRSFVALECGISRTGLAIFKSPIKPRGTQLRHNPTQTAPRLKSLGSENSMFDPKKITCRNARNAERSSLPSTRAEMRVLRLTTGFGTSTHAL